MRSAGCVCGDRPFCMQGSKLRFLSGVPNSYFVSFIKVFCLLNSASLGFLQDLREQQKSSREPCLGS